MATWERGLKAVAVAAVALVVAIYYGAGPVFQFWPDSSGYLAQARGVIGELPYARPSDRNIGYPLFVAPALLTPQPALTLVLAQAIVALLSFVLLYRALTRLVLPCVGIDPACHGVARAAMLAGVAAAGLYSVVHVQIAALLTETLFTALALVAVVAAVWLVLPGRKSRRPWLEAAAVAAIAALPLLVKPHWQLVAPVLTLIAGLWLWWRTRPVAAWILVRAGHVAGALLMPLAVAVLLVLPDRLLAERHGGRDHALFGPRAAFCNHVQLMLGTLGRRPHLTLQDEPAFERELKARLSALLASHTGGWRLLGFNGDLCTFDDQLSILLDRRFPEAGDQRRFLLGSVLRSALADPWPYVRKVAQQMAHGFLAAFGRFAVHGRPGLDVYRAAAEAYRLPAGFTAGIRLAPETGPLGAKARLDGTLGGRAVQALLAVVFHVATALLVAAVSAAMALPATRWRRWDEEARQRYLALIGVPLVAILAHHGLIAMVHTFDVWRYGFNMFFVNVYLMGAMALVWLGDLRRGVLNRPSARSGTR